MWLDPAQQESWRAVVGLLTTLPGALDADLRRGADLSMFEYTVLASLSEASERTMQMSALATRCNATLSRLSHVVSRLERRGWIRREVCGNDARATNAVLTAAGSEKIADAAPGHVRSVRDLVVGVLTPRELQQLGGIARKIEQGLAKRATAA